MRRLLGDGQVRLVIEGGTDADPQRAENGITLRDQIAVVVIAQARHECACRASLSDLLQLIRRVIHIGQHGSARIRLRQPVPQRIVRLAFCGTPADQHLRQPVQIISQENRRHFRAGCRVATRRWVANL